jgi:hypothetical protein
MSAERKIVVGLEDLKAVTVRCRNCPVGVTVSPDDPRIPTECPSCESSWRSDTQDDADFLNLLSKVRKQSTSSPSSPHAKIRILLEFDEAELAGRN